MNAVLNIQIRAVAAQAVAELKKVEAGVRSLQQAQTQGAAAAGVGSVAAMGGAGALAAFMPKAGLMQQASAGIVQFGTKLEGMSAALIKTGKNLQWTGRQLQFSFTIPVALAFGAATKFYMDNARQLAQLTKVYQVFGDGVRDLNGELGILSKTAELLSNKYGVAQAEVLKTMGTFAEAGFSSIALMKATQLAIETSMVANEDLGQATTDLITIQAAYNLSTDQLRTSLQQMNAIQTVSGITFSGLIDVVSRAGATANTAGIDLQHLAAMASALVPATGSASQAGNALKTIISRLLAPTKQASDTLKKMGINVDTAAWQTKNGTDRFNELAKSWGNLSGAQKVMAASWIDGRFQMNRSIVLLNDLLDANGNYQKSLQVTGANLDDATAKQKVNALWQKQMLTVLSSSPQQMKILWATLQNAMAKIIVPMIPLLMTLVQNIVGLVTWFSHLNPGVQSFVLKMLLFLAILGPVIKYIGAFYALTGVLFKGIGLLARGIGNLIGLFTSTMTAEEAQAVAAQAHAAQVQIAWTTAFQEIEAAEAVLRAKQEASVAQYMMTQEEAANATLLAWGAAFEEIQQMSLFTGQGEALTAEAMAVEQGLAAEAAAASATSAAAAWDTAFVDMGVGAAAAASEVQLSFTGMSAAEIASATEAGAAFDALLAEQVIESATAAQEAAAAWAVAAEMRLVSDEEANAAIIAARSAMMAESLAIQQGSLVEFDTLMGQQTIASAEAAQASAAAWEAAMSTIGASAASATVGFDAAMTEQVAISTVAAEEAAGAWVAAFGAEQLSLPGMAATFGGTQEAMALEAETAAAASAAAWETAMGTVEASQITVIGLFEEVMAAVETSEVTAAEVSAAAWDAAVLQQEVAVESFHALFGTTMAAVAAEAEAAAATATAAWDAAAAGQATAAAAGAGATIAATEGTVAAVAAAGVEIDTIAAVTEAGIVAWPVLLGVAIAAVIALLIVKFHKQLGEFFTWVGSQILNLVKALQFLASFGTSGKIDFSTGDKKKNVAAAAVPAPGSPGGQSYFDMTPTQQEAYKKAHPMPKHIDPKLGQDTTAELRDMVKDPKTGKWVYSAQQKAEHVANLAAGKPIMTPKSPQDKMAEFQAQQIDKSKQMADLQDQLANAQTAAAEPKKKVLSDEGRKQITAYMSLLPQLASVVGNVTQSYDQQSVALDNWKTKLDEANKRLEIQAARLKLLELAPEVIPQMDSLIAQLGPLHQKLDQVREDWQRQDTLVKSLKTTLDSANAALKQATDQYKILKDTSDKLKDSLDAAKTTLSDLAKTPIQGMKAMADQIFENTLAQKKLRLEFLQMEDAVGTIDEINKKLSELHGEIEKLQGERDALRAAGAGSDILGPMDAQIGLLQQSVKSLEGTGKPLLDLQDKMDALQRKGEQLDLSNAIQFDPLLKQIEDVTTKLHEMPFDELFGKIVAQQGIVDDLTTKWGEADKATQAQADVVTGLTLARDAVQLTYDAENEKLGILKGNYDSLSTAIGTIEDSIISMVSSVESSGTKIDDFALAAGGDFGDIQKKINALSEGGIADMADLYSNMQLDANNFDPFKPLKEKWDALVIWFKGLDWSKLFDFAAVAALIVAIFTGNVPAAIIALGILIANHWRTILQDIRNVVQWFVNAINGVMDFLHIPLRIPDIPNVPEPKAPTGPAAGTPGGPALPGQQPILGPPAPTAASGAMIGKWGALLASGAIPSVHVGAGFITNQPRAIVGEGSNQYPEYVIPTDPQYRKRANDLYNHLGTKLMALGGGLPIIGPVVGGVTGAVGSAVSAGLGFIRDKGLQVALAPVMKAFDLMVAPLPAFAEKMLKTFKNTIYDLLRGEDSFKQFGPIPKAYRGAIIRGTSEGTVLRAGERNRSEAILPLPTGGMDDLGKKEIHFHGDLSFPNITSGDDAETFIRNLEALSS